ncbi:MAG: response regulator, partial [Rhodospirillaceae bacterium]
MKLGHTSEIVENGIQALAAWRSGRYALLLTDCQMPGMDGYELARTIRREEAKDGRYIPIIAFTASVMAEETKHCLKAGMDICLAKPVELAALKQAIERLLPPSQKPQSEAPAKTAPAKTKEDGTPLDIQGLANMFGENKSVINRLLAEFRVCNERICDDLITGINRQNWDEVRHAAHSMAGASRTVGAKRLAELSSEIERAVLAEKTDQVGQLAAAADQYFLENGKRSVALSHLVGPKAYVKALNVVNGEAYPTHFTQGVTITVTGVAGARTITYAP